VKFEPGQQSGIQSYTSIRAFVGGRRSSAAHSGAALHRHKLISIPDSVQLIVLSELKIQHNNYMNRTSDSIINDILQPATKNTKYFELATASREDDRPALATFLPWSSGVDGIAKRYRIVPSDRGRRAALDSIAPSIVTITALLVLIPHKYKRSKRLITLRGQTDTSLQL